MYLSLTKGEELGKLKEVMVIAGSHRLTLPYDSKCSPHGHNRFATVLCKAEKLDENGMVANLTQRAIHDTLDHANLNELLDFYPTAEKQEPKREVG